MFFCFPQQAMSESQGVSADTIPDVLDTFCFNFLLLVQSKPLSPVICTANRLTQNLFSPSNADGLLKGQSSLLSCLKSFCDLHSTWIKPSLLTLTPKASLRPDAALSSDHIVCDFTSAATVPQPQGPLSTPEICPGCSHLEPTL